MASDEEENDQYVQQPTARERAERAAAAALARSQGKQPQSTNTTADKAAEEATAQLQAVAVQELASGDIEGAASTLASTEKVQAAPAPVASATANDLVKSLSEQLECLICRETVFQPVSVLDCLHTFCGSCLVQWVSSHPSSPECPACRSPARATKDSHQHNSLRDVLIKMDPSQDRTDEEKEEMRKIYHPGSNIDIVQSRALVSTPTAEHLPAQPGDPQQWQNQMLQQRAMRPTIIMNPIDELNLLLKFYFPCPTCEPGNPFGYLCQHPIPDPRVALVLGQGGRPIPRTPATIPRDHCFCFNCRRPNLMPVRDRRQYPQDVCAVCSERFCQNLLRYCGPIKQSKARQFSKLADYVMPPRQGLLTSTFNNLFGKGSDPDSIGSFMPHLFGEEEERVRAFDHWLKTTKRMNLNEFYHAVVRYAISRSPGGVVLGGEEPGLERAPWQGVPGRFMKNRITPSDWVCIVCAKDLVENYAKDWYNEELRQNPPPPPPVVAARPKAPPQASSSGGFFSSIKKGFNDLGDKFNDLTVDPPLPPPQQPRPLLPIPPATNFADRQVLRGSQVPKYPTYLATSRDIDGHPIFLGIYHHTASGSMIPAKVCVTLRNPVRVALEGKEYQLTPEDKYEPFLENKEIHKWVRVSDSTFPQNETPVQAGVERDGRTPLYFACAWHEGLRVPGYAGPNTMGCHIPFGGEDVVKRDDYEVMVWRR